MLARDVEGVPPQRERSRRIADALHVEAGDLLFETAFAEQNVRGWNAAILEIERRPLLVAHEARRLADGETGRATLDQNGTDSVQSGCVAHINQKQLGFGAVGRK